MIFEEEIISRTPHRLVKGVEWERAMMEDIDSVHEIEGGVSEGQSLSIEQNWRLNRLAPQLDVDADHFPCRPVASQLLCEPAVAGAEVQRAIHRVRST